jgi:hypothetical protein
MRFNYNPATGVLSLYVKKSEFEFAGSMDPKHQDEYRVFSRDFSKVAVQSFVEDFSNFTQEIFNSIYPEEKLRDIIALSTCSDGYTWTSLLKLEYQDEAQSFLNNLMSYALHVMQQQSRNKDGSFIDNLAKEEAAKLNLIIGLMNYLNYQQPWKRKKSKEPSFEAELKSKMKSLSKKIKALEAKYQFSTEEMLKYYKDDDLPDREISNWIKYNEELNSYERFQSKQKVLKTIVDMWMDA